MARENCGVNITEFRGPKTGVRSMELVNYGAPGRMSTTNIGKHDGGDICRNKYKYHRLKCKV